MRAGFLKPLGGKKPPDSRPALSVDLRLASAVEVQELFEFSLPRVVQAEVAKRAALGQGTPRALVEVKRVLMCLFMRFLPLVHDPMDVELLLVYAAQCASYCDGFSFECQGLAGFFKEAHPHSVTSTAATGTQQAATSTTAGPRPDLSTRSSLTDNCNFNHFCADVSDCDGVTTELGARTSAVDVATSWPNNAIANVPGASTLTAGPRSDLPPRSSFTDNCNFNLSCADVLIAMA
jgi:hypothetical protein